MKKNNSAWELVISFPSIILPLRICILNFLYLACVYGDPHIVTLDGFKYTFNGLGEFVLIETNDDRFTLQGRMVQALNNIDNPIAATIFSAIVGKEVYSDTVQFQLTDDNSGIEVLMNGELVDFEGLTEQVFNNVTIRQENSTIASAVFASGVYLEVRAANGILSTLLVSLAESYRFQTTGLMGNFDNDISNDLLPRGSDAPISLASSLQDIHNQFGVTCKSMHDYRRAVCVHVHCHIL